MIGDEGALDPHQNETRTAWSVSFRRAACGHCPLVHDRRLGSSPDVDSRVTLNQAPRGCAFIDRSIGPHRFVVNKELEGINREPPPEPQDSLLDSEGSVALSANLTPNLGVRARAVIERGSRGETSPCDRVHSATELGVRWIQVPA
jgi:hypothetical protein